MSNVWHGIRTCDSCGNHVEGDSAYVQIVLRAKKITRSRKYEVVATYCLPCAKKKELPISPEKRFSDLTKGKAQ